MRALVELVRRPDVFIADLAAYLDGLSADERWTQLETLGRSEQRSLFQKAEQAAPVSLTDFVPSALGPMTPVHHQGRNTLPLPRRHRLFQKRFCRPPDGSHRLFGYNESPSRKWIGPGFFVAHSTSGKPEWERRGAIVIDYFQVPDGSVPPGWPTVIPNHQGLQRFVYHRTRDFMRRVSTHVTIGAAYKGEKALDHYFLLCRS